MRFAALAVVMASCVAWQARGESFPSPSLTAAQIVEQIRIHDEARTLELKHYTAQRHYRVEYRGFATTLTATMDVDVVYDAASGKKFKIVSETGSKFLCDKVLRRAVESEKEAAQDRASTALTPANYTFQLDGADTIGGRPAYVLDVAPVTPSKFLYRGKIWVDAADFAVVKIDAEPARNPSVWISRTEMRFTSVKTGDFWLPEGNRSETKVRIGGTAVLTIRYGPYQLEPTTAVTAAGSAATVGR